jgi:hypothetical protein
MKSPRELADAVYEAPLPPDEFERRLAAARKELEGPEGDALREFIAWFRRRYPTPLERIRYARREIPGS